MINVCIAATSLVDLAVSFRMLLNVKAFDNKSFHRTHSLRILLQPNKMTEFLTYSSTWYIRDVEPTSRIGRGDPNVKYLAEQPSQMNRKVYDIVSSIVWKYYVKKMLPFESKIKPLHNYSVMQIGWIWDVLIKLFESEMDFYLRHFFSHCISKEYTIWYTCSLKACSNSRYKTFWVWDWFQSQAFF